MKISLWKDIRKYSKTKGIVPLDERQMNALKNLYMELAKSLIIAFMVFIIAYGYMELYDKSTSISFLGLSTSLLGIVTYYYTLRFCYLNVIGLDTNFEIMLVPAFLFTPMMILHALTSIFELMDAHKNVYLFLVICTPLYFMITYWGANRVYRNGKIQMEKEMEDGEIHFRPRRILANYVIVACVLLCASPISYDTLFRIALLLGLFITLYNIYRYGFTTPNNDYILNNEGLFYHKALWGKKGGFLRYSDIKKVQVQDTFNIGYAKDKIKITCQDDRTIFLFPENAYEFYSELRNNL